jgi:acetyltransferase-like isoleucine patch superfamily enzyme
MARDERRLGFYLKHALPYVADKIKVYVIRCFFSRVEYRKNLRIGKNSGWNWGTWINAQGGVEVGSNVLIGPGCIIHSANHKFDRADIPIRMQGYIKAQVRIEDDCWLGANVIVLPGVTIGKGSVIGAGSVVTENIPPYSVAVGNPAKVIRSRKTSETDPQGQA